MARIKKVNCKPQNWLVRITVEDEKCVFSVNPKISYMKIVKALNPNAAVKAAATYCNKKMKDYPETSFVYSTTDVEPYFYPIKTAFKKEDDGTFNITL